MKLHKRGDGDAIETAPLDDNKPKSKKKSEQSVIIYVTILFTVAFLLVLLSYFMQQRRNEDTISDITEEHTQWTMQAQQNIERLQNDNFALQEKLETALDENKELESKAKHLEEQVTDLEKMLREQGELNIEELKKLSALQAFMNLRVAYLTEDTESLPALIETMEENMEYLEAENAELCKALLEEIKNTEEEEK